MNTNLENPKLPQKYLCNFCNFNTCNKKDYTRHLTTDKHKGLTNPNIKPQITPLLNYCICGKSYKHLSSLCAHKKKCIIDINAEDQIIQNDTSNKDDLINYLIKENKEFKNLILEIVKKDAYNNNSNNNNTTNSHNKAFNLQFFLNETCKDAMNIMDFVDSIKLQLSDLINFGELGYVEGISNIIVKNLKELDVEKRPVHCTDKKRETIYVKDENKWEKDEENVRIVKAIKRVVTKNQRLLLKFKETYPDYKKYHSKYSDQYNKLLIEAMGGSGNNDREKEEKIIRNISKSVVVEK